MRLLYWLLDLIFPRKCALCGKLLTKDETDYCRDCRMNSPYFPVLEEKVHPSGKTELRFLDSFTAVWYYKRNVRTAILRLKFHGARFLAVPLGRSLAMKLYENHPEGFDCLTWVPVSAKRKRKRGYNQSYLLAKALGKELGMKPQPLLEKVRDNPAQSGVSADMRRSNVAGVYALVGKIDLTGKRILLIDDVFTTGSTAEECARVLREAGAGKVHCAAVAAAQKQGSAD